MKVHTYVIAVDAGAAPNYDPPCTTLAVCKPRIRRKAAIGDFVLAFAGCQVNPHEPHTVVWAGVVSEKLTFAEYWNDRRFSAKKPTRSATPDNFYRPTVDGGLLWIDNPVHGPESTHHDTGGEYVLVLERAWRFGAHGPCLPAEFGLRMMHGRRGERVHDLTEREWKSLQQWLDQQARSTVTGPSGRTRCHLRPRPRPKPSPPARRTRC